MTEIGHIDMHTNFKMGQLYFPFELGHFEACESYDLKSTQKLQNGPKQKGKIVGVDNSVTWPISLTAVLGHFEVYLVSGHIFAI